jgi:hypothetical protein
VLEERYLRLGKRFDAFEATIHRFGKRIVAALAVVVIAVVGALLANYGLTQRIEDQTAQDAVATCQRANEFRDLTRSSLEDLIKAQNPDADAQVKALAAAEPVLDGITATKRDCQVPPRDVKETATSAASP